MAYMTPTSPVAWTLESCPSPLPDAQFYRLLWAGPTSCLGGVGELSRLHLRAGCMGIGVEKMALPLIHSGSGAGQVDPPLSWAEQESWLWGLRCNRAASRDLSIVEWESWPRSSPGQRGNWLWWHGCRKPERLTNLTTAQAQLQGFKLSYFIIFPSRVWRGHGCGSIHKSNSRISESL